MASDELRDLYGQSDVVVRTIERLVPERPRSASATLGSMDMCTLFDMAQSWRNYIEGRYPDLREDPS